MSSSTSSIDDAALKKKLHAFLQELQLLGTVQGFKHFTCYVRGKEEVVVSVHNKLEPASSSFTSGQSGLSSRKHSLGQTDSFNSARLPYDKGSLILSHSTQIRLSCRKDENVGLPPASPSEWERASDKDVTLFLIAGYGRYSCPYVWVRSNHERLLKLSGDEDADRDSPLKMKSTSRWLEGDVHVTDVIAEIVKLCTYPAPRNPFEVDLEYFHYLSSSDQLLSSAAMVSFLQKIVINTPDSKPYAGKVMDELQHMAKFHFNCLKEMSQSGSIPALQQQQNQQLNQQEKGQRQQRQHLPLQRQQQRQDQQNQQVSGHHGKVERQHSGPGRGQYPQVPAPEVARPPTQSASMSVQPTYPYNANGPVYEQGSRGAYPGGFDRMPAPSMF